MSVGAVGARVAVVGAGPAGFFTVEALLKTPNLHVDLFERLHAPFGLVRYGVAPDHQRIKSVEQAFARIAGHERVRLFLNVRVGRDIGVDELAAHYGHVVFACGCEAPRRLGLPGEDVAGVHSALEVVSWYNAHPDFADAPVDLAVRRVAVVGAGDVAMDVVRLLTTPRAELMTTDMADYALEEFARSRIEQVDILIRRGPVQASFALKELRAVVQRPHVRVVSDVGLLRQSLDGPIDEAQRAKLELLLACTTAPPDGATVELHFSFLRSPTAFEADDEGRLAAVRVAHNELVLGDSGSRARDTGRRESRPAELAVLATGYQSVPMPGLPFDADLGLVPNVEGRVVGGAESDDCRHYVVGWMKRGPQGVIGTNKSEARAVAALVLADLEMGGPAGPLPDIGPVLTRRGVRWLDHAKWCELDAVERERGARLGRPRVKLHRLEEALERLTTRGSGRS